MVEEDLKYFFFKTFYHWIISHSVYVLQDYMAFCSFFVLVRCILCTQAPALSIINKAYLTWKGKKEKWKFSAYNVLLTTLNVIYVIDRINNLHCLILWIRTNMPPNPAYTPYSSLCFVIYWTLSLEIAQATKYLS